MKIYTKTGDKGTTSLYGGDKVSKSDIIVSAYGEVDELNSFIGLSISEIEVQEVVSQLKTIQYNLFVLASEVATPKEKLTLANGKNRLPVQINNENIIELESWIDVYQEQLPEQKYFILPSGGRLSAGLHIVRSVCRRVERSLVVLVEKKELRPEILVYINRLSDYFFVLARYMAHIGGYQEEYWKPREK